MFKYNLAWLFAFVSSLIYVYISYVNKLYIEALLQFFYVVMAVYGWVSWRLSDQNSGHNNSFIVVIWSRSYHFLNLLVGSVLACLVGYIFSYYTEQANPYTDAFITVFSLITTYMVVKKVLENWIYWIVVDAACVYLFASRSLYMTSILYTIFCLLAIKGYWAWYKLYKVQPLVKTG